MQTEQPWQLQPACQLLEAGPGWQSAPEVCQRPLVARQVGELRQGLRPCGPWLDAQLHSP